MADQSSELRAARENVAFLDPRKRARAVFEELLENFAYHQAGHDSNTVKDNIRILRRFSKWMEARYDAPWPWLWERHMAEAYSGALQFGAKSRDSEEAREPLAVPTIRTYQGVIRRFQDYLLDPRYPWVAEIERAFGQRISQVFDEFNTIKHHPAESGAKSADRFPLPRDIIQQVFDYLDDTVDKAKGKSILPAARDSAIFKTYYAYGHRNSELALTELHDLSYNPYVPEYGRVGALLVRHGKGSFGSGPKTRLIRTVPLFEWSVEVLEQYLVDIRPRLVGTKSTTALFPSERHSFLSTGHIDERWADIRRELGLDERYKVHSFRPSYMTHLLEAGYPAKFIQLQVGHGHLGSMTTYTNKIGDEFCNAVLRNAQQAAYTPRTPAQAAKLVARIEANDEVNDE